MQKTLQVYLPYAKGYIVQRFGDNANISYARDGLKGHTSYDWGVPYGTPIPNCTADAYCYSRMHDGDSYLNDYRAVFFIVETETGVYELSYGHLSSFTAQVGQTYQVGDIIGFVGNTGDVFSGTHEVTEAEKDAGSHAGAHLHGPQIRVLRKDTERLPGMEYVYTSDGYLKKDDFYFAVPNYDNGYNGCVSLRDFSTETLATDYKPTKIATATAVVAEATTIAQGIQQLPAAKKQAIQPSFLGLLQTIANWLKSL